MTSMLLQNHQADPVIIQAKAVRVIQWQIRREIRGQLLQMERESMIQQNHRKRITPVVTK